METRRKAKAMRAKHREVDAARIANTGRKMSPALIEKREATERAKHENDPAYGIKNKAA